MYNRTRASRFVAGGMTACGIAGDVWRLTLGAQLVWRPVSPSGAPPAAGRTYHGAMARPAPVKGAPPPSEVCVYIFLYTYISRSR